MTEKTTHTAVSRSAGGSGEPQSRFSSTLGAHGIELTRGETTILQVNVGLLCNQTCRHCHLECGPGRTEVMDWATFSEVAAFARRGAFNVVDITGGAPELNQHLPEMIEEFSRSAETVTVRTNLTNLVTDAGAALVDLFVSRRVVLVASLPSLSQAQADAQRGRGIFERSIAALRLLNEAGYGRSGSALQLNLVSNPTGAFLPSAQDQAEKKFRQDLMRKWGIGFTRLYVFANVPLGRFRRWLEATGNLEPYMERLVSRFNPCSVVGLMCRSLVSVSWDGYVYDCDFNQVAGLPLGSARTHVSDFLSAPPSGTPIAVSDHCYACTAGSGFT